MPAGSRYEFNTYREFTARAFPVAEPLLGEPGRIFLVVGSQLMAYWPGRLREVDLDDRRDGPPRRRSRLARHYGTAPGTGLHHRERRSAVLFQQKLRDRVASWDAPDPTDNLFVFASPWGEFSFANPDARHALSGYCDAQQINVVAANPTLGLGVGTSGKPDGTQQFVDLLCECGLKTTRAFWLLHHENKQKQISGDWGRHPDTKPRAATRWRPAAHQAGLGENPLGDA
jgi:hypothetical protein